MALLLACVARGQTNFTYTSGTLSTPVPDGNPIGITESTTTAGLLGSVVNVQVHLDITGGFNGDLYAYLAGPGGYTAILLNRSGVTAGNAFGYADAGFNITLDDSGVNIHNYESTFNPGGAQLTGTWQPDGRAIDPQSAPSLFDSTSPTALLGGFDGYNNANGTWTLFLADLSAGGQSTLVSWGLTVVTVPEPQTWAMLAGGAGMLFAFRRRGIR